MRTRTTQGTGRHGHKDTEEPYAHSEAPSASGRGAQVRASPRSRERDSSSDLRSREYRDEQGNIHHHTRTSQAMKGKSKS
jgi:hypothetical protein